MNFRQVYSSLGPAEFYRQFGNSYKNPHEKIIHELITTAIKHWKLDSWQALDLAAGSGEVTRALLSIGINDITATDPFTAERYQERTGRICDRLSFQDIALGKMQDRYFSLVICSFAMHLVEKSWLPTLSIALAQMCKNWLIICPTKRPIIETEWGWHLRGQITIKSCYARLYDSRFVESKDI